MKLIESNTTIISQANGLEGIYKAIEIAGRTCYKSEDNICEGSAKKMVDFLVNRGHGSPLEHGSVYLTIQPGTPHSENYFSKMKIIDFYLKNTYSKVNRKQGIYYISSNYRVLVENDRLDDLQYICEPTEHHEKRYMVKFTLSRSIANEFVRHRVFSFCQESQRYCSYNLGKFNGQITYIVPEWVKNRINDAAENKDSVTEQRRDYLVNMPIDHVIFKYMSVEDRVINCWMSVLENCENEYLYLINSEKLKPQEARSVLPNDCKTELIMTGFASDWTHFFKLRTASGAHPDAKALACPLYAEFKLNNYI